MRDAELFARIDAVLSDFDGQHSPEPGLPMVTSAELAVARYEAERVSRAIAHLREIGRWND